MKQNNIPFFACPKKGIPKKGHPATWPRHASGLPSRHDFSRRAKNSLRSDSLARSAELTAEALNPPEIAALGCVAMGSKFTDPLGFYYRFALYAKLIQAQQLISLTAYFLYLFACKPAACMVHNLCLAF